MIGRRARVRRRLGIGLLSAAATLLSIAAHPVAGQDPEAEWSDAARTPIDPLTAPRPSMRAVRIDQAIHLDGRLDEAAWDLADVATDFVQNQPQPGHPASQRTEVRILYDANYLYIGAVCYDSEMDRVIVPGLEREFDPRSGDIFALAIDPFHDERNSFVFISHPLGAERDEQTFDNSRQVIPAWEGVWRVEASMTDSAWVVEMEIPFKTLRFEQSQDIQDWGINFARIIRRHNEWDYWAPLARHEILHQMARAGDLTGFHGIEKGTNLHVKPYVLGGYSAGSDRAEADLGSRLEAGLDVKYGLTPGLTVDLTVNTDFAQVELDEEQLNLTRFALFLPERRDFFIENQGTFNFGDVTERGYRMGATLRDFSLFHSRRIGLTGDGRTVPILGGARMSGRAGGFDVGLLTMQTRTLDSLPAENFVVARIKRNVLGSSDVGLIFVSRHATSGAARTFNRSIGADANLRLIDHLVFNSYVAATLGDGEESDGIAAKLGAAWRDSFWNASTFLRHVDGRFDPGVGFLRRRAMRHFYATVGVHPQPATPAVQELNPFFETDYITDLSGKLETRRLTGGLAITLGSSAIVTGQVNDTFERLDEPFRILSGTVIEPGDYRFTEGVFSFSSSGNGFLRGDASVTFGEFWSGSRRAVALGAGWRPRYDLYLDLSVERNFVDLPERSFTVDVAGVQVEYAFDKHLFGSAFIQHNSQSEELVTSLRGQFRYLPLSDVFIAFTERRDTRRNLTLDRSFALKATRMFAF